LGWLSDWSYRKSHTINGSSAGAQTNYQIRIKVHRTTGTDSGEDVYVGTKCKADFGDIRFTKSDGATLLDYWLEEYDSGVATFWVEVDSIPVSPGTATIYIYYGKTDAVYSGDPDDTFILAFDDEATSVGSLPSGWTDNSDSNCSASVQDDQAKLGTKSLKLSDNDTSGSAHCISQSIDWTGKYVIHFYYRYNASTSLPIYHYVSVRDSNETGAFFIRPYQDSSRKFCVYTNTYYDQVDSTGCNVQDQWYLLDIFIDNDSKQIINIKIDETDVDDPNNHLPIDWNDVTADHVTFDCMGSSDLGNQWIDGFFIRKYISPEPSHGAWGPEETSGVPSVVTYDASDVGIDYATLNGEISDMGDTSCDERGFEWGYSSGDYTESWTETGTFGTGSFSYTVTGLQKNALVYFRAKAHNSKGWGYGQEKYFSTKLEYILAVQSELEEGIVYTISSPPRLLNLPVGGLTGIIIEETSSNVVQSVPGLEGGKVIFLGSEPQKIILTYRMVGENVPQDLANIQTDETYWLSIVAHDQRWFNSTVRVNSKRIDLAKGTSGPFALLTLEVSETPWKNANIKTEYIEQIVEMYSKAINITSAYSEEVVNMQKQVATVQSVYTEEII